MWDVVDRGLAHGGVGRIPEGGKLEDAVAGLPPDKDTGDPTRCLVLSPPLLWSLLHFSSQAQVAVLTELLEGTYLLSVMGSSPLCTACVLSLELNDVSPPVRGR